VTEVDPGPGPDELPEGQADELDVTLPAPPPVPVQDTGEDEQ
jgi:hypothetical protein